MPSPGVQVCPFHSDEIIRPIRTASETAEYTYRCSRKNHPVTGPFEWPFVPEPERASSDTMSLGLDIDLPVAVRTAVEKAGREWVEYGLVEREYALAQPAAWNNIIARYDHTYFYDSAVVTRAELPYTGSMYLARTLGALSGRGALGHRSAPGTGRWAYNNPISYYGLPGGDPFSSLATWEESGVSMTDYMPESRPESKVIRKASAKTLAAKTAVKTATKTATKTASKSATKPAAKVAKAAEAATAG